MISKLKSYWNDRRFCHNASLLFGLTFIVAIVIAICFGGYIDSTFIKVSLFIVSILSNVLFTIFVQRRDSLDEII